MVGEKFNGALRRTVSGVDDHHAATVGQVFGHVSGECLGVAAIAVDAGGADGVGVLAVDAEDRDGGGNG